MTPLHLPCPYTSSRARPAFTLAETLVSVAILAVVLTAVGSLIALGARSLPSKDDASDHAARLDRVLQTMSFELGQATGLISLESGAVEFTLPDQTGDLADETIRYAWSGTPGDPLIRTYNGNQSTLLDEVDTLELGHVSETATVQTGTEDNISAEQVLASYTDTASITASPIRVSSYPIQIVRPIVPATAQSFRVTAVRLLLRRDGLPDNSFRVQLWRVNSAGTLTANLGEVSRLELEAGSSLGWMTFTFSGLTELSPGTTLAIVLPNSFTMSAGQVGYRAADVADWAGEVRLFNSTTSATTVNTEGSILFELLGRITSESPVTSPSTRVSSVTIALRSGSATRKGLCRIVARPIRPLILTADAETSDSGGLIEDLFGELEGLGLTRVGSLISGAPDTSP